MKKRRTKWKSAVRWGKKRKVKNNKELGIGQKIGVAQYKIRLNDDRLGKS